MGVFIKKNTELKGELRRTNQWKSFIYRPRSLPASKTLAENWDKASEHTVLVDGEIHK